MPNRNKNPFQGIETRETTELRLQWAIWKVFGPKVQLDGERMQRLAEALACELYSAGVRLPIEPRLEEVVAEVLPALAREYPDVPLDALRARSHRSMRVLLALGFRKCVSYLPLATALVLERLETFSFGADIWNVFWRVG